MAEARRCVSEYPLATGTATALEDCIVITEGMAPQTALLQYDEVLRIAEGEAIDNGEATPAAAELARRTALLWEKHAERADAAERAYRLEQSTETMERGLHMMQYGW